MNKQCSNCGLVAGTAQFPGISQQCPRCEEWVIWQPLESPSPDRTRRARPGERSRLQRFRDEFLPVFGR